MRRDHDRSLYARRMVEGSGESDHSTHRIPDDIGGTGAERIEHRDKVIGVILPRIRAGFVGLAARPVSACVDEHHLASRSQERLNMAGLFPRGARLGKAM